MKQVSIWIKKYWVEKASQEELFHIIPIIYNLRTYKTTCTLVWLADCNKGHKFFPSLSAHRFVMWLCRRSFQGRDSMCLCSLDFWLGNMTSFGQWTSANVTQLETWKSCLLWRLFSYCSWNLLPPHEQAGVSLVFDKRHVIQDPSCKEPIIR